MLKNPICFPWAQAFSGNVDQLSVSVNLSEVTFRESSFPWKAMLTLDSQIAEPYWFRHMKISHYILINHSLLFCSLSLSLPLTRTRTRRHPRAGYLFSLSLLSSTPYSSVLREIHWRKPFSPHSCVCIEKLVSYFALESPVISKGLASSLMS